MPTYILLIHMLERKLESTDKDMDTSQTLIAWQQNTALQHILYQNILSFLLMTTMKQL